MEAADIETSSQNVVPKISSEKSATAKEWLGGFKNPTTSMGYHNAQCNTDRCTNDGPAGENLNVAFVRLAERNTQTVAAGAATKTQTAREVSCQTKRHDLFWDGKGDRIVLAKPYTRTSEVVERERLVATQTIQRQWRGYKGRRRAEQLREQRAALIDSADKHRAEEERRRQREADEYAAKHPRAALDAALAQQLEVLAMRRSEIAADTALDEAERTQLLLDVVAQQAGLIHEADRLRRQFAAAAAEEALITKVTASATPVTRRLSKGLGTVQITPPAVLAAQLKARIFEGLLVTSVEVGSSDASAAPERLVFLKEELLPFADGFVKQRNAPLAEAIRALVLREVDMLQRGRPPHVLQGLQQRISKSVQKAIST